MLLVQLSVASGIEMDVIDLTIKFVHYAPEFHAYIIKNILHVEEHFVGKYFAAVLRHKHKMTDNLSCT